MEEINIYGQTELDTIVEAARVNGIINACASTACVGATEMPDGKEVALLDHREADDGGREILGGIIFGRGAYGNFIRGVKAGLFDRTDS